MALELFYITNRKSTALIAEKYGVNRIWVDLETMGKELRQPGNTVKSRHKISDIAEIKPALSRAKLIVRVNPWNEGSAQEINSVIDAGADIVMLPMWKTVKEAELFLEAVGGRARTNLLLETKEAVDCIDDVLKLDFDEIHIGLNDLHLSYGLTFMFELLSNGTVENLCRKFKDAGVPYGFGGIAKLGDGLLPAEKIVMEHYRLGSTMTILSRTFCDNAKYDSPEEIDRVFRINMKALREYESSLANATEEDFLSNKEDVARCVANVVAELKKAGKNVH